MLTSAELTGMRATSAAALPDTCTITRPSETGSLNTSTGVWTPSAASTIFTGACRVRPVTSADQTVVFGEDQVTKQRYVGTFPHSVPALEIDDIVAVSSSSDTGIMARTFRVVVISSGSWHIDRRVGLEVVE